MQSRPSILKTRFTSRVSWASYVTLSSNDGMLPTASHDASIVKHSVLPMTLGFELTPTKKERIVMPKTPTKLSV
jgi:hypothetical protein